MVDSKQVQELIEKILQKMDMHSSDAVQLVYRTGLVESRYKYIRQLGTGPARSFWQVEPGPTCCLDICNNYLKFRKKLTKVVCDILYLDEKYVLEAKEEEWSDILEHNIAAGIIMCRLKFWRVPKPIPHDLMGQAKYWKKYYNSDLGAGTPDKFIEVVNGSI